MIELLWCDPHILLRNRKEKLHFLRTLTTLYGIFCEALEEFYTHKNYHLFDPHVGDNLCQVRACQLGVLARKTELKEKSFSFF